MVKLAVIADDLTGSNDTAVQFAKIGMKSFVLLDRSKSIPPRTEVVVVDTDSRSIPAVEARVNVKMACEWLQPVGAEAVFKKVDSTLRGNMGAEIEEALQCLSCDLAVIAPAFPRAGRITAGGYHLVRQQPVSETEIARDPKTPVTESRLEVVVGQQTTLPTAHVALYTLLQGQGTVAASIEGWVRQGKRLICFDATTEQHLQLIAQAAASTGKRILWVGSAGLAEMLPGALAWPQQTGGEDLPAIQRPVLVAAGSMSSVTTRQLEFLRSRLPVKTVLFDAVAAIRDREQTAAECCRQAAKWFDEGYDVVLEISGHGSEAVSAAVAAAAAQGIPSSAVSDAIAARLSEIAARLTADCRPGALILTGGDTAVSVCRALNAAGLYIMREVSAGVPLGCVAGGPQGGLPVVTKAGAFGEEDVFVKAIAVLRNTKEASK